MYATNYFEEAFLNTMRGVTFTPPLTVYAALFISSPGDAGAGTEVMYTNYARQPVVFSAPALDQSLSAIAVHNADSISFPVAGSAGGTVNYLGLFDAQIGGNCLLYAEATTGLNIRAGETPTISASDLKFYSTGGLSNAYKIKLLDALLGNPITAFVPYVALFNGSPDAGGSELAGDNYARALLTFNAPTQTANGFAIIENSEAAEFNKPSSSWGTWTHTAIMDAQTGGNAVYIAQCREPTEILKGYLPTIAQGAIKLGVN